MSYLNKYTPRGAGRAAIQPKTPATKPLPGRKQDMIKNSHGQYVFKTSDWDQLSRFLILGTEDGSFYINERNLTLANCKVADKCIEIDGKRVVDMVVDVSVNDRALKTDPALFVLAMAAAAGGKSPSEKDIEVRKYAISKLPQVARTATHLYHWVGFVQQFRGWGRTLRAAIQNWYATKRADKVAYQALKYKSRDGWSHKDVFRLAHPMTSDLALSAVFKYIARPDESPLKEGITALSAKVGKRGVDLGVPLTKAKLAKSFDEMDFGTKGLVQIAAAEELLHIDGSDKAAVKQAINLITEFKLPREAVPTHLQTNATVQEALLNADMGLTAMVRTLNRMTASGLLDARSAATRLVVSKLGDKDVLRNAHIHPMTLLIALRQYAAGRGDKGSLTWSPVQRIVDALDEAFYASFEFVEATKKDILVAVDISGSMDANVHGVSNLSCRDAAGAMALVMLNAEPNVELIAFGTSLHSPRISKRMRLDDVITALSRYNEGTNITLPFVYAEQQKARYDAIVSFTDSETWANRNHTMDHLRAVRRKHGMVLAINCATEANRATGLDSKEPGVLEVSGFDAALPQLVTEFIKGKV
jgi:60 kDa SS-A/Ro ribonucleoprotein